LGWGVRTSRSTLPSPNLSPEGERLQIIDTGLPLDWLADEPAQVFTAGDHIATLARDLNADLIHLNSPTLAARARFSAPVVAAAHGCVGTWWQAARGTAPDPDYAWHADLMAAGLRAADTVVAPTSAFAATLQRTYDLLQPPLAIHNGRTPLSLPDAAQSDAVLTTGRLWDEVKGATTLDQVAALVDTPFRAAGPLTGPHGESVTLRHLHHLGTLGETALAAELAGRPIFVSAATFEPFGLSVLEAAQAGCPLILSDIDTFRELWTGAALFVPARDPQGYADAIVRIRTDTALRTHLSEVARLRAMRYTPQAQAGAMAAIYAALLAQPAQSQPERAAA
jgi:glycosyltransferase involved in cell wall biosynthesis